MATLEKKPLQNGVEELRKLRDEIRVRLHLASLDAKSFWESVEPKLVDVEKKLENGVGATAKYADVFIDELTKAFTRMRDRFGGGKQDDASN